MPYLHCWPMWAKKIDIQYELEQKIIEILLLYGSRKEDFEDLILKENEDGELILEPCSALFSFTDPKC